ncbi:hypothetical protein F2Q69_00015495 [Brassica cretica]|uniref:Uncharacterized protein n=1 Tax=Brassica cretica TaxID=69181 RepID=A0A8S9R8M2_BRACR|nr:hypothetical protein F2Q69_00015495 [Brassica cretica]
MPSIMSLWKVVNLLHHGKLRIHLPHEHYHMDTRTPHPPVPSQMFTKLQSIYLHTYNLQSHPETSQMLTMKNLISHTRHHCRNSRLGCRRDQRRRPPRQDLQYIVNQHRTWLSFCETPSHMAAKFGCNEPAKLLLARGAFIKFPSQCSFIEEIIQIRN